MLPGTLFVERFEIERRAGSGGMGTVHRALDRKTGAVVALKLLHDRSVEAVQRFTREAEVLHELSHPAIVRYVAHGISPTGEPYLAMEWLDGEDLAARLTRGAIEAREAVAMIRRVAYALESAHARGIVHRDIKPTNLFLPDGDLRAVKLVDFGIARLTAQAHTATGALLGTPGYMAPEQARGDKGLDARADIFALGCVLFECITGRAPFMGEHVIAVLAKILLEEAPRLSEFDDQIPESLTELTAQMLAKRAEERPADAHELARRLTEILEAGGAPLSSQRLSSVLGPRGQQLISVVLLGSASESAGFESTLRAGAVEADPYRTLWEVAEAHGGRLERLADGSALIAIAGTGAATDQAARAARCALAVHRIGVRASMSLATGLGDLSPGAAVGEVIDRGVRLLKLEADGISIDDVTAGLLDARFEVVEVGETRVLRAEHEPSEGGRTLLGRESPCVGRDRDLSVLRGLFEECANESLARAVLMTAPAGIGKSRVQHELCRSLADREPRVSIWIGRADPMRAGSPLALLSQALRGACGVRDGDPESVQRQKIRAAVAERVLAAEQARVAAFLAELVGVPFTEDDSVQLAAARRDPNLMGVQMRRAFEDFLAAECAATPVLIVLEDLHWGDLPSVSFIDDALRSLEDLPWMVLALARPEVENLFPKLWHERRSQVVRLEPLTRNAAARLVRSVLGDISDERVAAIVEHAEGNAFCLEELVRAEAEGARDRVPKTVVAVAQARLESLPAEAQRLLRAASVFGRLFWRGAVARLVGNAAASELSRWLAELARGEMIVGQREGRFLGEQQWAFRHALLREAAYETLTSADRALGHRLAAQWLVEKGERDSLSLAEHFERGGEPTRAIEHYARAAEQALEGHDYTATVERAERGVECGATGEARGALRLLQTQAHRWRVEYGVGLERARQALDDLPRSSTRWFLATGELAVICGGLDQTEEVSRIATLLPGEDPDPPAIPAYLECLSRTALIAAWAARVDLADVLLRRFDEVRERAPGRYPVAEGRRHAALAVRLAFDGDAGANIRESERALACMEEADDLRNACLQLGNLGGALMEVGDYPAAERTIRTTIEMTKRLGISNPERIARANLGVVLAALGQLDEGAKILSDVIRAFAESRVPRLEGTARIYLSSILLRRPDLEGAEREAREALSVLGETSTVRPYALAQLAQALLRRGRAKEAREAALEAWNALGLKGSLPEGEALVRLSYAEALEADGDPEAALEAFRVAVERLHARASKITDPARRRAFLENVPEHARTLELAAERLGPAAV